MPKHRRPSRRDLALERAHEPQPAEADISDWGPEPMVVVDYTSGGAPFGTPLSEYRESLERDARGAGWARAKAVLRDAFEATSPPRARIDVGRVTKIGDGCSREVYVAEVEIRSEAGYASDAYAALLPRRGAPAGLEARTRREIAVLAWLASRELPFRVPRVVAAVPEGHGLALVQSCERGVPLDLRAGRQPSVQPWDVVAQIAAGVHAASAADPGAPVLQLAGAATQRGHGLETLRAYEGLGGDDDLLRAAGEWARAHLPPDEPAVLLHGDLLGQNILLSPPDGLIVLDWQETRFGDPAYDLAIVTRGVRQPFQTQGGLERLLEAYERRGGRALSPARVRFHELFLAAEWYRESLAGRGGEPPEQARMRLRGLLKRAGA